MHFEWDEAKAASNLRKHGISFHEATEAFADPLAIDEPESYVEGEARWKLTGTVKSLSLVVVIHTTRHYDEDAEVTRIISARLAEPAERRRYELG